MSNYTNNLFKPNEVNNSWTQLYGYIPAGSRVLDVGCSSGNFGDVLIKKKGCEVVGIDIDAPDVARAKKVLTQAYRRNIEQESIDDLGIFDVVLFADVLEHLLDPIAALEKAKKVLKPGGRVVFSIPNMAHISVRLMLLKGYFEYTPIGVLDRTHLHYYDEIEVEHLFAAARCKIVEISPTMWSYPKSKISEELYNMGLGIIDDKLYKTLEDTKANVWQFVGYAQPTTEKLKPSDRPIHYRMPPEELTLTLEARDRELTGIGKQLKALREENDRLQTILKNPLKHAARQVVRKLRQVKK